MKDLKAFVSAVANGQPPTPDSMEAAADAVSALIAFQEYHRRCRLGAEEDIVESIGGRNIDAARRLVRRVLAMLQRPIARSNDHAVLVGGVELNWLASFLLRVLESEKGEVRLIAGRGRYRHDDQRLLERYAAITRDDMGLSTNEAMELTEVLRQATPELRHATPVVDPRRDPEGNRDRFRKDLLEPGRKALARRTESGRTSE